MQQCLQTGWFDATFPSTSGLSAMLEAEVLAEIAAFQMATDNWAQGFELLSHGLTAGYPDACAYQRPYTLYVGYAMTQHKEVLGLDHGADVWVRRLKEVLVLQAWNLRCVLTTMLARPRTVVCVSLISFAGWHQQEKSCAQSCLALLSKSRISLGSTDAWISCGGSLKYYALHFCPQRQSLCWRL